MDKNKVGQIFAGASVVLSLLFVGYEIRQNTAVARVEAYQGFVAQVNENTMLVATDPVLAPLLAEVRAGAMPADFDDEEQLRLYLNYVTVARIWEGLYQSVREGVLRPESLEIVGGGGAFNNSYFRAIWPSRVRPNFSAEFVEFFETLPWADGG